MDKVMISHKTPKCYAQAYSCPHCGVYAHQNWKHILVSGQSKTGTLDLAYCAHCSAYSVWQEERMIYPAYGGAPLPNPDLPDDKRADYEEARSIVSSSPRGAAALLRLAIQKLCKHLGESGENLNTDIGSLVKNGLDPKVQKALDLVRVIGNNAVHPGQIDLKDDADTAGKLFGLVNLVAEATITVPKHVDEFYEALPESKQEAIARRDRDD